MRVHPRQLTNRLVCALILMIATVLLALAPAAAAEIPFCTFGSGPGQCKEPRGVAVDRTSGRVYVVDNGNSRVNVFKEDGEFIFSFGSPGADSGQFSRLTHVAVDNDPTSSAFKAVYVVDSPEVEGKSQPRVQRFDSTGAFVLSFGGGVLKSGGPVAVGPDDNVYVAYGLGGGAELKIFTPTGTLVGTSQLVGSGGAGSLAVDSTGNFYVFRIFAGKGLENYQPTEPVATLLDSLDSEENTTALAIDDVDNLYAAQRSQGRPVITKRDSSGTLIKRFGYAEIEFNLEGLSVGATGDLFGAETYVGFETKGNKVIRIPQPAPGPLPCCLEVQPGNTKATVKGGVNPEGKPTTYHFEYIAEAKYLENAKSFGAGTIKTSESAPVGPDFLLHEIEAHIGCKTPEVPLQPSCLEPETAYRYRLVAKNEDGENFVEGEFETKAPFEIGETYATEVGTGEARIHAEVNPLGIPATAYFEYVDEATHQESGFAEAQKTPSLDAGSGEAPKAVSAQLSGLAPATTYHYRLYVTDPFVEEPGPELVFTTFPLPKQPTNACPNQVFRTGPSAYLPDCRAYEMVSPVDKNGGDVKVLVSLNNYPARLDQSADDGERFAYSSVTAFAGAESSPWSSEYLATRTEGKGWSTEAINTPRESPSLSNQIVMKLDVQYKHFSPDLLSGWLVHDTDPTLDECAPEGWSNLYRRDNLSGEYESLIPVEPLSSANTTNAYRLELQGLSVDESRAVFRANAQLTPEAAKVTGETGLQLYEHIREEGGCGELRLISVLPNGKPATPASVGSGGWPGEHRMARVGRAVSADGTRVFWTTAGLGAPEPLYVRVNADQEQSTISGGKCVEPELACTLQISAAPAQFWTAATDGSKAYYTADGNFFEFDVEKALAGETPSTLIAGKAEGVVAATDDASRIYFVSREAIDGEGETGEPNLYLYEPAESGSERYRLVATLADQDLEGIRDYGLQVASPEPIRNGVRLSPDGSHLAFISSKRLTGYDNTDATDGRSAVELHLYDAESEEVRCISCNPSGARPQGREFSFGTVIRRVAAMMPPGESQTFAPRALSSDGNRLFFESFEALLPRDVNDKADVYGWQRASSQEECNANGAELYVPSAGGCISLISTGLSPSDTEIADATPDGSSVFIRTAESLLPQDPGQVDVYVARVNGGFPQPPAQAAACEGEACQGPLAPPNDPTPASSAFQGAGNVTDTGPSKPRCRKGKVRRKGRCVSRKPSKAGKQGKRSNRDARR